MANEQELERAVPKDVQTMSNAPSREDGRRATRWRWISRAAVPAATASIASTFGMGCKGNASGSGAAEEIGATSAPVQVDVSAHQVGKLTSAGSGALRVYNQYDALGRPTRVERIMDGTSYVYATTFGYPQSGVAGLSGPGTVPVATQFPDGETVNYTYDAGGAQRSLSTTPCNDNPRRTNATCGSPGVAQSIVTNVVRNVRGQTVRLSLGDGTEQDRCYNDGASCLGAQQPNKDLRLNRIRSASNAGANVIQDYIYAFDAKGNIVELDDGLTPSLSASYGYDSLDWLTQMTSGGSSYSYGYDNLGNLTTKEGLTQQFGLSGYGPHQLATAAGHTYVYDANGNVASRSDGLAVAWNAENMPVQVVGGPATTATVKFFVGETLWKKVQGGTTTYYMPSVRIENGALRKYFGTFAERDVDGTLKFYHPDHLGSSVLVTNGSAAPVHRAAYMPYGEDRVLTNYTPAYTENFTPKYQFNFKEHEQDGTGFYDYGARLYDPATGRWLSADTRLDDGQNRYAYVRNNPLLYIDPTGHWSIQVKGENAPATKEQREEEEKKLQRLAPGTTVDEYGNVHKAGYWQRVRNHFNGHAAGTALVTSLVDHKASTTIIIGDGHETETRPSGHDAVIYMSPKENAASRVLVWEGNKLRLEKADPAIILGHELIHALHIVQNDDFYAKEATHTVRSGTYSFTEKAGGDELRTIGVPGFVHWGDTNENTLRFELGYRQRAAWHEPSTPPPE